MARLTARVLGAAAGGSFPQWNCRCEVCTLAWTGDPRVRPATQTGIAVSADGSRWVLLNAAPDLATQIRATGLLHPGQGRRGSPIEAVVLTGGEVDQVAGLLSLRESHPFALLATAETLSDLEENTIFGALAPEIVQRTAIQPAQPETLPGGLTITLFEVPGKVPLYQERRAAESGAGFARAALGVEVQAGSSKLVFVPGAAAVTPELRNRLGDADVLIFDGTFYTDDEMIRAGTGSKTAARMGHVPIDGPKGSLAAFPEFSGRRIYIHINNTNPILIAGSPQRQAVESAGWEVAFDGMDIVL